jgi:DUF971 family protein
MADHQGNLNVIKPNNKGTARRSSLILSIWPILPKILAMTLQPSRVEVIGQELAVAWNDGRESFIPLEKLRRACPCAACGGEPDVMGNVDRPHVSYGPHSFELRDFRFVGGYALQPIWNDGHETGLYTFRQLRSLDHAAA